MAFSDFQVHRVTGITLNRLGPAWEVTFVQEDDYGHPALIAMFPERGRQEQFERFARMVNEFFAPPAPCDVEGQAS